MNLQQFQLTKIFFKIMSDIDILHVKDEKKREQWQARLYEFSEGFAKQIVEEYNQIK